jgi:hypothetical protein
MSDTLVCAALTIPLMIADNLIGTCDGCGVAVQYRPHAPPSRKVCMACFAEALETHGEPVKVYTTRRMLEDVISFRKKRLS